ncbi:MAG: hypothetical protein KF830_09540 [Planctomycetes bacterium]|nr:hypothetical protein [Planctomycetota bacterium]
MMPAANLSLALMLVAVVLPGQQPAPAEPPATQDGGVWSEGFGSAANYRSALAHALEDAVAKVKGTSVARGSLLRSRLAVVAQREPGDDAEWLDGDPTAQRNWVQLQLAGFVLTYEVLERQRHDDRQWDVRVKALVSNQAGREAVFVVELQDGDLREWQLERFDEEQPGAQPVRERGEVTGPKIGEYLRNSRMVKIAARSGVRVDAGSAARERDKDGQQLIASHRVVVAWKPVGVQSVIERKNRARPTSGPRPELLTGGSVQVSVRVENLVEGTDLLDQTLTIAADAQTMPVERLADYVNALVDKAKAAVAEAIVFAMKPPVVLRAWQEDGKGPWFVEAAVARRVAGQYRAFVVGNQGSLGSPDWVTLGRATLVGGDDASCRFRLEGVGDPSLVEANVTEVRPIKD